MHKLKTNILYTGSGMAFFQASNLVLAIAITNLFGTKELASYQLLVVSATLLSYFAKLGQDEKITYSLAANGGMANTSQQLLISNAITKTFVSSLIIISVCIAIYFILPRTSIELSYIELASFSFYLICFVTVSLILGVFRGESDMGVRSLVAYYLPNLICIVSIVASYYLFSSTGVAMLARALSYLVILFICIYFLRKLYNYHLKINFSKFDNSNDINCNDQNWLMITVANFVFQSGFLVFWSGKLLLEADSFGILSVYTRIAIIVLLAPTILSLVLAPVIAKEKDNELYQVRYLSINLILVLLITASVFTFDRIIIDLFTNEAKNPLSQLHVLLFACASLAITSPIDVILISMGKGKSIVFISVIAMTLYFYLLGNQKAISLDDISLSFLYSTVFILILKLMYFIRLKL